MKGCVHNIKYDREASIAKFLLTSFEGMRVDDKTLENELKT